MAKKRTVKKKKAVVKKKVAKKRTTKTKKRVARPALKKSAVAPVVLPSVGEITHYFPHVSAGVIKLTGGLKMGDIIQIKGHTTDFKQTIESVQINHVPVSEAKKGDEIGIKVKDRVRIGDIVYKL